MGFDDLTPEMYEQRVGVWTVIECLPDRVEVRHSRACLRAWILAPVLAVLLGALCVPMIRHPEPGVVVFVSLVVLAMLVAVWHIVHSYRNWPSRSLVLTVHDQASTLVSDDPVRHFLASDVLGLELRDSGGRDSDDSHLMQLWVQLRGLDRPVLIHQHYFGSHDRVLAIARQLALRWGCGLRQQGETG